MNSKNILRVVLLSFVAISVVVMATRVIRESAAAKAQAITESLPANGVVVYYFHSNTRCPTCQKIEEIAHEAVEKRFAKELANGTVQWHTVNYEASENAQIAEEFEIMFPSVVIVRRENGSQTEWKNLSRVWQLVGDRPSFSEYVMQEVYQLVAMR